MCLLSHTVLYKEADERGSMVTLVWLVRGAKCKIKQKLQEVSNPPRQALKQRWVIIRFHANSSK